MRIVTIKNYDMTIVSENTKRCQGMVWAYEHSDKTSLSEIYKKPSDKKKRAYDNCKKIMKDLNGYDFRLTGYNYEAFSAAFKCNVDGTEVLIYLTRDHNYII